MSAQVGADVAYGLGVVSSNIVGTRGTFSNLHAERIDATTSITTPTLSVTALDVDTLVASTSVTAPLVAATTSVTAPTVAATTSVTAPTLAATSTVTAPTVAATTSVTAPARRR